MKRCLAIFLIALMATAIISAADVVTAQKATAASDHKPFIVQYKEGKTYTFEAGRLTYATEFFSFEGAPGLSAFADKDALSASLTVTEADQGISMGLAIIDWQLKQNRGFTDADLAKPCTVNVEMSYTITASGVAKAHGIAAIGLVNEMFWNDYVYGTDPAPR